MSPEQVQGQDADARSDIFSFGCVLYEMLTGKRAFDGGNAASLIAALLERPAPSIATIARPASDRVLQRCLAKDPDDRWQSARDLAFALESIAGTPERQAQQQEGRPRRYVRTIALAAGVCVLAGAAIFVAGRRTSRTPSPSFQRVTFRRGVIDNGRFANAGRTIAYSASWDGNPYRVYSTQAESPESRDLGIVNGHLLGVSPSDEMALALTPDLSFLRCIRNPGSRTDLGWNTKRGSG